MIIAPPELFPVREFFWGQVPGIVNFVIGILAINYGRKKNEDRFMLFVLGSMTLSMVILAVFILFLLYFLNLNQNYYIITVFIFYFLYLIFQLIYLVKTEKKTHPNNVH
jgi:Ca2+/Na+ antiporter